MGFLRLGIIVNFISHSVMSAFTSAAGITIGTSQLKYLFGVKVGRYKYAGVFQTLYSILSQAADWDVATIILGFSLLLLLFGLKKWKSAYPKSSDGNSYAWYIMNGISDFSALFAAVLGTVCSYIMHKEGAGVLVVGELPTGLRS